MTPDIRHLRDEQRFETIVEGQRCELVYRLAGKVMTIVHTGVPPAVGGRGIAGALVRSAFETARGEGWKVVPACSYSAVFAQRHPEYSDLIA